MQKIVAGLTKEREGRRVPNIVFTKGGALWLEAQAESGADALGLDWTVDIGEARKRVGDKVALQGNLDPAILLSTPEAIEKEVGNILASYGKGSGHPAGLNFGDVFSYALAKTRHLPLLFKGEDFSKTDIRPALPIS